MTSPNIASLLGLLDRWRHLPTYQLERRADIFFGLFLPVVLNEHLASPDDTIQPCLIPEFPIRKDETRRSYKADYLAVSTRRTHAFLVELKTDMNSLDTEQLCHFQRAVDRGLAEILRDVRFIAGAREPWARKKYFHLLKAIARLGLITLPEMFEEKIYDSPRGVYKCIDEIEITDVPAAFKLVVVAPRTVEGYACVDFESFADIVKDCGEIGRAFADSLRTWANKPAGSRK